REVRQCGIRREIEEPIAANGSVEPATLFLGPLIAPDDRGPQDFTLGVEQHRAVHLAGQADRVDGAAREAAVRERASNCDLTGAPPVRRILLGPAPLRASQR